MINEGIYETLSSEEYHGHKESYSRSALMDFDRSPYYYWAKHLNIYRPQKDATRNMALGSAFHTLILEPHLFGELYGVEPKKVLLKDVGREDYDAYKYFCEHLQKSNKTILTFDEMETLIAMQESLYANEKAKELLRDGLIEHSYFWRDPESGLMLKSRPDILHRKIYVDLKTCSDASPRAYQREMIDFGYHLQSAMIRDAVKTLENREISSCINICVETKYPHAVAIYLIDEAAIEWSQKKYKELALHLKHCLIHEDWPSFSIQTIGMPAWAI